MSRETLLILPSLKAAELADGRVVVTEEFLDGMAEYVKYWDGPVAVILEPAAFVSNHVDHTPVAPAALPFGLSVLPFDDSRMFGRLAEAAVVLGGADDRQNHLASWCFQVNTPFVMITEYSLAVRKQIAADDERNPLQRWRRYLWETRQEHAVRQSVALAAGVQCNGLPTYANYRSLNENCITYFDTRVTEELVISEAALETRLAHMMSGGALRLAFSGRLIAMKGADHLPRLANELRALGVPFSLAIFGSGELEPAMRIALTRDDLAGLVQLKGAADFKTELLPYLRDSVDLFVYPHRHGDPSRTYLETLACGVPIAGYANEAWGLLLSTADVGCAATLDDLPGLARAVAAMHADREALARLSLQAWEFAKRHTFEKTLAARIEHLRQCAGLPTPDAAVSV